MPNRETPMRYIFTSVSRLRMLPAAFTLMAVAHEGRDELHHLEGCAAGRPAGGGLHERGTRADASLAGLLQIWSRSR